MTSHPIVLALLVMDFSTAILLLSAGIGAIRIVLRWRPEAASREQLALERRGEVLSLHGRAGLTLYVAASVVLVVAIASVLPGVVPGAMCGTGVVQAMGPAGERALWLRGLALLLLFPWFLQDALNRSSPTAPLTITAARCMLLAVPAVLLAVVDTGRIMMTLDVQTPVDCCAVVYDAVRTRQRMTASGDRVTWLWVMIAGAVFLAALTIAARGRLRSGRSLGTAVAWVVASLGAVWVAVAWRALVRELAAYHYGVLAHDCPWCLFALRHHLVGYPLFGALAVVGLEALAMAVTVTAARQAPEVHSSAMIRASRGALRVAIAETAFLVMALLPVAIWRIRHGVWIEG